jgi:predicted anti-sigma-YlaC factor YlaD
MERTNRPPVACDRVQEAISAALDHEPAQLDRATVDQHMAGCPACRAFTSGATVLQGRTRERATEEAPNLVGSVLNALPLGPGSEAEGRWVPAGLAGAARLALLLVALVQLVLAVPALVLGDESGASIHVARELGSWDVALAVAWIAVVLRPTRAVGLLPFAAALAAVMGATAVLDIMEGHRPVLDELHHALGLVGLGCTWLLSRSVPRVERLLASFP